VEILKAFSDHAQPGIDSRGQTAMKWYIVQCTAMKGLPVGYICMGGLSISVLKKEMLKL
jgi:hypothetical protein